MLEFVKKVLTKVSFDRELFQKELRKSLKLVGMKEIPVLYSWCLITFGEKYKDIILQVFEDENILM